MKVIEDSGFCTSCGKYQELMLGEDNYSLIDKNIKNYEKFKDIFVYKCSGCGFVNYNITNELGVLYPNVVNDKEYRDLLDYADLEGLDKELYDCYSNDCDANELEAFALICLKAEEFDNLIRATFKASVLKESLRRKYRLSQDELGGEEDNDDDYEKLDQLLAKSIKENYEHIVKIFEFALIKNPYTHLIYVETLLKLNENDKARKNFENFNKKFKYKNDIVEKFNLMLNK